MKKMLSRILPSFGVLAMLAASPAYAQDDAEEEIVVTGTSIRGVAPAGAEVIGLGEQEIEATGATTTAQLLASIPQLNSFNLTPTVLGANNFRQSTNRPNVRGLPVGGISGGSPTLLLMDGHRIVGSGVIQTSPDSDVLPPGVIQRVEVATDGGSAVYGSDAVGGVVNYITRRSFDGFQADTRIGFADDYQSTDIAFTAGRDWGTGNVFVSYNYLTHDGIYGRDRDYVRDVDWTTPDLTPRGRACAPGNVTSGPNTQGIGAAPGEINVCDPTDDVTLYPQSRKDAVFASFTQELNDHVTFDLDGYYMNRVDKSDAGALTTSVQLAPTAYWYDPAFGPGRHSVAFSFEPVTGNSTTAKAITETWGFIPSVTVDLGSDWQMRALLNYGHSQTATMNPELNSAALLAASLATNRADALNPYNPELTRPAVLAGIFDSMLYGRGENELGNARAVFDGPLFALPAGDVRLAIGVEYEHGSFRSVSGSVPTGGQGALAPISESRDSKSLFAELNIPIVSAENNVPLVHALTLNVSERYDDYSDFGSTSNPRIGVTYEPLDWITLRGTWGESFQAPSLANIAAASTTIVALRDTIVGGEAPGAPFPTTYFKLFYSGSAADLKPQTSTSYSFGFDVRPPWIEGLDVSMTYYNIEYRDKIALPPIFLNSFYTDFPDLYLLNPALGSPELEAYLDAATNGDAIRDQLIAANIPVYTAYESLQRNLGSTRVDGVDASVRYNLDTDFGVIFASANGSYRLGIQDAIASNLPYTENYAGTSADGPRFTGTATVGAVFHENLLAQATLNYSGPITYPATPSGQTHVEDFTTLNLYVQYDFVGEGLANDLTLSLGVNNVFDEDPSLYEGSADPNRHGWANGATLGRLVQIGVSKHF